MLNAAKFIGQVLFVLGLAGLVFWLLPPEIYALVGAIIAFVTGFLMWGVEGEDLDKTIIYAGTTVLIAVLFGGLWPALPVIVAWGRVMRLDEKQRIELDLSPKDIDDLQGPPTP